MRAIIFSDLHLHDYSEFSTREYIKVQNGLLSYYGAYQANSRILDVANVLEQIRLYADSNKIQDIFFLGDIIHSPRNIKPELYLVLKSWVEKCYNSHISLSFLSGNHDIISNSEVSVLDALGVRTMFGIDVNKKENIAFYWVPYMEAKIIKAYLEDVTIDRSLRNFMFGHFLCDKVLEKDGVNFIKNCMPYDIIKDKYDYVFLGDYHKPVDIPELKITSVGGIIHQNFGDATRPQGSFIDFNFETLDLVRVPINAPMFQIIGPEENFPNKTHSLHHFYRVHVRDQKHKDSIIVKMILLEKNYKIKWVFEKKPKKVLWNQQAKIEITPRNMVEQYCNLHKVNNTIREKGIDYVNNV